MSFIHSDGKSILFDKLMSHIKFTYKVDYRDVAGRNTHYRHQKAEQLKKAWAFANGFGDAWNRVKAAKTLNKDVPEYRDYIAIEQGWYKAEGEAFINQKPYLDVWHWLYDNDFEDFREKETCELDLTEERILSKEDPLPPHVMLVFSLMHRELKDLKQFDLSAVPFRVK